MTNVYKKTVTVWVAARNYVEAGDMIHSQLSDLKGSTIDEATMTGRFLGICAYDMKSARIVRDEKKEKEIKDTWGIK